MRHDEPPPGPTGQLWDLLTTSADSWRDVWQVARNLFFSLNHLLDELSQVNLTQEVTRVGRPIHLVHGRHDRLAPPSLAHSYLDQLRAPAKQWT
jgi:pimeloyl-ACP methyl ester carboxylesterase